MIHIVIGFEPVVVSSLERRYRFSSTAASLIISVFDIAVVISVILITYFGDKGHKPRWIGIAFCIQGIGALVFALPQFIFGKYQVGSSVQESFEACNDTIQYVSECNPGNSIAYAFFIFGNIIMGIGAAPLFTIGVSYIDDIVFPKWVSIHIGLFQVSTIAGPAIGFGIGSIFLKIYVDPGETTALTEADPSWVGAWWLGFIVIGIVSFLCSIPFFFYPRLLDDSHLVMKERQKQMTETYKSKFGEEKSFLEQIKAFPYHLCGLFKSKTWVLLTIGVSVLFLSLDGLVSFAPKYIESVYRIPPSTAGLLIGAMGRHVLYVLPCNHIHDCMYSDISTSSHIHAYTLTHAHTHTHTRTRTLTHTHTRNHCWCDWDIGWSVHISLCEDWKEYCYHKLGDNSDCSISTSRLLLLLSKFKYCWS